MDRPEKILIISKDSKLKEVLDFCFRGWGYKIFFIETLNNDITPVKKIAPDVIMVDAHSATKAHLDICRLLKEDFITASIPLITLINKRQLRTQLLRLKQGVDDYLIKPPDPLDLRVRAEMAMRRSQYTFFTSPLTGLPGGRNIEEALKDRIKNGPSFSFGYLDIDNFKYFNDNYGYLKGDRVIMQTAYILYTVIKKFGNKNDFMGHIGGDDFVFITSPEKYKDICHNLILEFDKIVPFHYSVKDRRRGFITARDRTNNIKNIPIMSVSIAVVSAEPHSRFKNVIEMNEKLTEVKGYLKKMPGSKFMEDRRDSHADHPALPRIYKREPFDHNAYQPMGQALLEKRLISVEKLDEALCLHWRRGLILGEILKELNFIKEKDLDALLTVKKKEEYK